MKNQWRFLLLRSQHRRLIYSSNHFSQSQFQVHLNPNLQLLRSFTSLLNPQNQIPTSISSYLDYPYPKIRSFSSETALEDNNSESDHVLVVTDIFSKPMSFDDVRREIEVNNVVISHDMVLKVLCKMGSSPDVARSFFEWVVETDSERLSSKCYNMMLSILRGSSKPARMKFIVCSLYAGGD